MNLIKSFSLYTFVGFLGAGINFLLMPILTHYLTPEDFGITSLLNTYVTIIIPFIGMVSSSYISVEYFNIKQKEEFARLFSSVLFIPILPTILLALVTMLLYENIYVFLELPYNEKWLILGIFPISILSIYIESALNLYIIRNHTKMNSLLTIVKIVIEIGLTVLFVVFYEMGWKGRFLSWLLSTVLVSVLIFILMHREKLIVWSIKREYVRAAILFGYPLIVHTVGKFVINQSDRLFIANMVSVEEAGIYSVGYTIGSIILIVGTAFSNIFVPYIMEKMGNLTEVAKSQIRKLTYLGMAGIALVVVILSLLMPIFFRYAMDPRFEHAGPYVFWVAVGYLFGGGHQLFGSYIYFYKKTRFLALVAFLNIFLNIVLNYFLIQKFGGIGAAYATAISFLVDFIFIYWKVVKLLPWLRLKTFLFGPSLT